MSAFAIGAVKRWLATEGPATVATRCQECGAALAPRHEHVVTITSRSFLCVCVVCSISLPSRGGSSYRAIPARYLRLPPETLTEREWEELQIPVGIAFFFRNSVLDTMVACYPSPAGPVESQLPLGDVPWARNLTPDVEALLVRRTHQASDCFLVPIDAGYELVGLIRRAWRGLGGGPEVAQAIEDFFEKVDGMTRGVP